MTDITENGKYYTPSIEEFHVGFECEVRHFNPKGEELHYTWRKAKAEFMGNELVLNSGRICSVTDVKNIRVKHLDHDDIVECGWKEYVTSGAMAFFKLGEQTLNITYDTKRVLISVKDFGNNVVLFNGTIRNKSELQRIMRQIGITK